MEKKFNPSEVAIRNGNFFGFPYSADEAEFIIITVPWDVTVSYRPGTSGGPLAMTDASVQLDFYDHLLPGKTIPAIATDHDDKAVRKWNRKLRKKAVKAISFLENGGELNDPRLLKWTKPVDKGSEWLNRFVYQKTEHYLKLGKKVILAGGDHSVPLGMYHALANHFGSFGMLQFDAHADLRKDYEGFSFSHASVMYNALQIAPLEKIVQVGIRDICTDEIDFIAANQQVKTFFNHDLRKNAFTGLSWDMQCDEIIKNLPHKVHISFDVDALEPAFCPSTGTPVPGGLSFDEAVYLIEKLALSGRMIIGCDLCEVTPGKNETDQNIGARLLYKMICMMKVSANNQK